MSSAPPARRNPLWVALWAISAGALTGFLALVVTAACGALGGWTPVAAEAVTIGAAAGAGTCAATLVLMAWRHRLRGLVAIAASFGAAILAVSGVGMQSLPAMATGVQAGCAVGMGDCLPTHQPKMPVLLHVGAAQHHPVIRVILWGVSDEEGRIVLAEAHHAPDLGQPLLRRYYGVQPAADGGSWTAPGTPQQWLRNTGRAQLLPADISRFIEQAEAARHWTDSPETQWWFAADLSSFQIGIGAPACGDHVQVPRLRGSVVRLPFASCTVPALRSAPSQPVSCRPLSVVRPSVQTPDTIQAGIDLIIDHEFAEAATDPVNGWYLLVAARCNGKILLEIADVCEPDGSFIAAPPYETSAGWQPSLLEPSHGGHRARCVNPARP